MKFAILALLLLSGSTCVAQVTGSGFPAPPSNATVFSNLQNRRGWALCEKMCAGSTHGEMGTSRYAQGIASPSLSGSASRQQSAGTTTGHYWNSLYFLHISPRQLPGGGCGVVTHMSMDKSVYIGPGNSAQGYEFDPDLYCGGYKYFASLQCRLAGSGSGFWYLYNTAATPGKGWTRTPFPCDSTVMTEGTWHRIQLLVSFDQATRQYTYITFYFDNNPVFVNLNTTFSARTYSPAASGSLNEEQQIDGKTTPHNNTMYIDNDSLAVW